MPKEINLIINNCGECPYSVYSDYIDEFKCKLTDQILFADECLDKDKDLAIHYSCTLQDKTEDK